MNIVQFFIYEGEIDVVLSLTIIFILVLLLPLTVKIVERNLEMFLFLIGLLAAFITGVLDKSLFIDAAFSPIPITIAVLVAGVLFRWMYHPLRKSVHYISRIIPFQVFIAFVIILLGLISSVITAIIAALVLVFISSVLNLERKAEIRLIVVACFAIGLGAALTPIGEPLSTIAINKLNVDFFYFLQLIGKEVILAIIALGILGAVLVKKPTIDPSLLNPSLTTKESYDDIFNRSFKIYFFVMGLTFLGAGFEPFIHQYVIHLNSTTLYWINMISAILDNATLTAAEISIDMDPHTVRAIILGLIISGGMLIPGNIPNIIAASKRNITSKEWLQIGVPLGLLLMIVFSLFL